MGKPIIIAIAGKSGSGKDTLKNKLLSKFPQKLHNIITMTTRPKRDCEVEGVDYYFKTEAEMAQLLFDNKLLEAKVFNNWVYGTGLDEVKLNQINIGVYNLEGIETLQDSGFQVISVYIDTPDKIRLIRYLNREGDPDIDEMFRRYKTDREDFDDYEDVVGFSGTAEEVESYLKHIIERFEV